MQLFASQHVSKKKICEHANSLDIRNGFNCFSYSPKCQFVTQKPPSAPPPKRTKTNNYNRLILSPNTHRLPSHTTHIFMAIARDHMSFNLNAFCWQTEVKEAIENIDNKKPLKHTTPVLKDALSRCWQHTHTPNKCYAPCV